MNNKRVCFLSVLILFSLYSVYAKDYFANIEQYIINGDIESTVKEIDLLKQNKKISEDDEKKHKLLDYENINSVFIAYNKYVAEYNNYLLTDKFKDDFSKIEREYNLFNNYVRQMGTRVSVSQSIIDLLNNKLTNSTTMKEKAISLFKEATDNREKIKNDEMLLKYQKLNQEENELRIKQLAEQEQKKNNFISCKNRLNGEMKKSGLPSLNEEYDIYHFIEANQKNNNLQKNVGSVFWTLLNIFDYDFDSHWIMDQKINEYEIYMIHNEIGFVIAVKSHNNMPLKGQRLEQGIYKFKGIEMFLNYSGGEEAIPVFEFITNDQIKAINTEVNPNN